jgi:hypothetical protein
MVIAIPPRRDRSHIEEKKRKRSRLEPLARLRIKVKGGKNGRSGDEGSEGKVEQERPGQADQNQ